MSTTESASCLVLHFHYVQMFIKACVWMRLIENVYSPLSFFSVIKIFPVVVTIITPLVTSNFELRHICIVYRLSIMLSTFSFICS